MFDINIIKLMWKNENTQVDIFYSGSMFLPGGVGTNTAIKFIFFQIKTY